LPSDSEFQRKYDDGAHEYDTGLGWLFASFRQDQASFRRGLVDKLDLRPGMRVIETGCGTGQDSAEIAARIAPGGELYVQDLSIAMLQLARRRLRDAGVPVKFVLSNASYLPLPTGQFDAAFHFGGINTFGDVRRAIDDMTRVVRPGGAVVFGDEGVAPWLRRKRLGRILVKANPLYRHRPPIDKLPDVARDVRLSWLLGNAFYVIEYRVGESPPFVDLDLPIPGPRNGTLRSRYYDE
jgi:ubiquinone/menaquinone biosynthesis C-methylase UbiE